ncbi:phage tail protein [Roseibium sediminis]|uniref:phage tail protein n=1 Tax=Roseibium sediminis TaxID=1775174 RepID=UPI00123E3E7F|nr:phage tail protein [Roseibium sediminis]
MVTDAKTQVGNLPKPHPDNNVNEDFQRVAQTLEQIAAWLNTLQTGLAQVPGAGHQHEIGDIQGLTLQLQTLADGLANHTHSFAGLTGVNVTGANEGQILQYLAGTIQAVVAKAQFFAHDPISGLTSNNVQSALSQLASQLDQLRGGNAPETLDTIIEIASAVGNNQASLLDLLEQIGQRATKVEVQNAVDLLSDQIDAFEGIAPGFIAPYAMFTPPDGWLECNGAAISRTAYAALFNVLGTGYGAGDGATTFNVPDLRGEFIRGFDNGRGVDPGRGFATWQGSENKTHAHSAWTDVQGAHQHGLYLHGRSGNNAGVIRNPSWCYDDWAAGWAWAHTDVQGAHGHNVGIGHTGTHEARPRNVALKFLIKY